MLLKLSKRPQQDEVTLYESIVPDIPLAMQPSSQVSFDQLVFGRERIIRVHPQNRKLQGLHTLEEEGFWVSTGKLVWFRNRDLLAKDKADGEYPLYWAFNQTGMSTPHPVDGDREQWLKGGGRSDKMALPAGSYCVVNRFSSKEQPRRIHASCLESKVPVVLDNKLNYVHRETSRSTVPLTIKQARGVTIGCPRRSWMNGTGRCPVAPKSTRPTCGRFHARLLQSWNRLPISCPYKRTIAVRIKSIA